MATAIHSLCFSGSRLPSGEVNAGGKIFLTRPGSASERVTGYADGDKLATLTLNGGGYLLGQDGKLAIFIDQPCVVRVEDQAGAQVDTFSVQATTSANLVEVISPGFTGINADTGQYEAGRRTFLSTALASMAASCGGTDGNFRGTYGSVDVPLKTEIETVHLTPIRFGGVGNGSADDTAAFAAMFAASRASGIPILIPKGSWKITSSIALSTGTYVVSGAGAGSVLLAGSTTLNMFTGQSLLTMRDLFITSVIGAITGTAVAAYHLLIENVAIGNFSTGIAVVNDGVALACSITATAATTGAIKLIACATTGTTVGSVSAVFA